MGTGIALEKDRTERILKAGLRNKNPDNTWHHQPSTTKPLDLTRSWYKLSNSHLCHLPRTLYTVNATTKTNPLVLRLLESTPIQIICTRALHTTAQSRTLAAHGTHYRS